VKVFAVGGKMETLSGTLALSRPETKANSNQAQSEDTDAL